MVIVYAANITFVSCILFVMWAYALIGRRLVEPSIDSKYVRSVLLRAAVAPTLFLNIHPSQFFQHHAGGPDLVPGIPNRVPRSCDTRVGKGQDIGRYMDISPPSETNLSYVTGRHQ